MFMFAWVAAQTKTVSQYSWMQQEMFTSQLKTHNANIFFSPSKSAFIATQKQGAIIFDNIN